MKGVLFLGGLSLAQTIFTGHAFAQTEHTLPPPSALKKLSLEEIMDINQ